MLIYSLLGCILTGTYAIFIFVAIRGWNKLKPLPASSNPSVPISVIIPCRNEKHHIKALFLSLEKQEFDKALYEVVFVDDGSEDGTVELIKELQGNFNFQSSILLLENARGKKAALTHGIDNCRFEHILTTDADCQLPIKWLSVYSNYFALTDAEFLAGPVHIKPSSSFFSKMQSLEFATLSGITASFFGLSKAIMCSGANLGFTKSLFKKVGGYESHAHIPSGDDVFFMHEAKKLNEKLFYVFEKDAIVTTSPSTNLKAFIKQRIRWVGKSTAYKDSKTINVAGLIVFYNAYLLSALLLSCMGILSWKILLVVFLAKLCLDMLYIFQIRGFFQLKHVAANSLFLSLLYPFYTIGIGVTSLFLPVEWKESKTAELESIR